MTASTKPSMIYHFPLQQIRKTEVGTAVVVSGDIKQLLVDLSCEENSVYNQSMDDSTDTTSVISSADSSIAMSVMSYPSCCCSSSSSSSEDDEELVARRITTCTAPKSALKQEESVVVPIRLQRQEKSHRRRIQFNPAVQQKRHLALHEYSTKELDACWLRGEEYAQIARSCRKQITMLEQQDCQQHDATTLHHHHHHHFQEDEYCFRGLESHARLAAVAKNLNRRLAWDAVLDEQCDQLFLGVLDDEATASRYRNASSSCQFWASRVAQQDQRAAEFLEYDDDIFLVLQD